MRFEYFPNADGGAAGATCKIFYRTMIGDQNRAWRLAGEFKIPEEVNDHRNVANRIGIHGRLLSGTLSDITYTEIGPDTQTVYYQIDESLESGYPDDTYAEASATLKITEFGNIPWYSIVLMVAGVLTGAGLLVGVIVNKKRKQQVN